VNARIIATDGSVTTIKTAASAVSHRGTGTALDPCTARIDLISRAHIGQLVVDERKV
jgi:hypothetical protein